MLCNDRNSTKVRILQSVFHVVTEQNKIEIVKLGALQPLIRLTRARDIRVKKNSAGALLNLSHVGKCLCVWLFLIM